MPPSIAPAAARAGAVGAGPGGDDELAARLRVAVTRLNRRLRQESLTGVSPSQEAALGTINRLGHPTLGELAQAEQVQPPTMTKVVAALEEAGLVARHVDAGDRRVSRVELTSAGRAALERSRSLKNAYLARQLERMTDEDRGLTELLASLLERLVEDR
jgi:DNA-binding MarR family transcriptional regulator